MIKQYALQEFISNYYELVNLVVFITSWKCEQWFTNDIAKKNFKKKKVAIVKQYPPKQFISNYYELRNLVVFIIAWKCEKWFTKDLAAKIKEKRKK